MNDHLKQLMSQALDDGDHIHYASPAFAERFAALIVGECAAIVSLYRRDAEDVAVRDTLEMARNEIRNTFGVK